MCVQQHNDLTLYFPLQNSLLYNNQSLNINILISSTFSRLFLEPVNYFFYLLFSMTFQEVLYYSLYFLFLSATRYSLVHHLLNNLTELFM